MEFQPSHPGESRLMSIYTLIDGTSLLLDKSVIEAKGFMFKGLNSVRVPNVSAWEPLQRWCIPFFRNLRHPSVLKNIAQEGTDRLT